MRFISRHIDLRCSGIRAILTMSACIVSLLLPSKVLSKNLLLVDELPNGFKFYRSGEPTRAEIEHFINLGIQEIAVLSGDAQFVEKRYTDHITRLKVVYNVDQELAKPLSADFLDWFDRWVEAARNQGKVIAIRCDNGFYRTGRLAAYYQMKYQSMSCKEAVEVLNKHGKWMFLHRDLECQVKALHDYINHQACSVEEGYCVITDLAGSYQTGPGNTAKFGDSGCSCASCSSIRNANADSASKIDESVREIELNNLLHRFRYNLYGFQPTFGQLTSGAGFAAGVKYKKSVFNDRTGVFSTATWSVKNFQQYVVGFKTEFGKSLPVQFGISASYRDFPEQIFYGPGNGSSASDKSNFALKEYSVLSEFLFQPHPSFLIGIHGGLIRSETSSGKADGLPSIENRFRVSDIPGFSESLDYITGGITLHFDSLDCPGYPRSGSMFEVSHDIYGSLNQGGYSFQKTGLELQGYLPVINKDRVIAARILYENAFAFEGDLVPLQFMPTLGGSRSLRGFHGNRFYGNSTLLLNLEYRFKVYRGVDLALFSDFGQTGDSWDDFQLSNFKNVHGIGVRFYNSHRVFLRFDTGYGDDGIQFFLRFSNVF